MTLERAGDAYVSLQTAEEEARKAADEFEQIVRDTLAEGVTQAQLAAFLGIRKQVVSKIANGGRAEEARKARDRRARAREQD